MLVKKIQHRPKTSARVLKRRIARNVNNTLKSRSHTNRLNLRHQLLSSAIEMEE